MGRTLSQFIAGLPEARRSKIDARVSEIITELPDRPPVRLQELGAIATKRSVKKPRRAPAAAAKRRPMPRKA